MRPNRLVFSFGTPFLLALLATMLLLGAGQASAQSPSQVGQWSPVLDWGVQAKHMILLPTGNVLVWSTGDDARVWDINTDDSFTPTPFAFGDLHCAGQATMADGRIVVIGGQGPSTHLGIQVTALFDAFTNTWFNGASMNYARWYATATVLSDGRLLATSGDDNNASRVLVPEIYDPETNTWDVLEDADRRQSLYPFVIQLPDGRIFEAGPKEKTYFLDITGEGDWTEGPRNSFGSSGYAESCVMYRPGKILRAGGSDPAWARAAVIDMNVSDPQWRDIADMEHARRRHDLTLMADGKIFSVGGTGRADDESHAVLIPEIWDPDTEAWTEVAAMQEARMYHSATVLLPDGRIVCGGGEVGGRLHAEVYSPPYLFQGPRPTITASPTAVGYGTTFSVGTPNAASIETVSLFRAAGGTHTFDQNQRYIPLDFVVNSSTELLVDAPVDAFMAQPGDFMLIIKNTNDIPSEARWVRVAELSNLTPGSISGQVTEAGTGQAIGGASIAYSSGTVTANSSGNFSLSNILPGQQTLTVSASGYAPTTISVDVVAGQNTVADVELVLPGTVQGQITSLVDGSPIVGANVGWPGGSALSDSGGRFVAENVPSGLQTISVTAIGWDAALRMVNVIPNDVVFLDFQLEQGHTVIEGEVLDAETGLPIPGATVSTAFQTLVTNSIGFYFMDNMPEGSHPITASAPGYETQNTVVQVVTGFETTQDFDLIPIPGPTYTPTDDAYVKEDNPTNNYGDDDYLRARTEQGSSDGFYSYLRFDASDFDDLENLLGVKLRLRVTDESVSGGDFYLVSNSWTEESITWNNAPSLAGSPIANLGQVNLGDWVEIDVSSVVTGAGVYSFGFKSPTTNSVRYSSKEGADPPQLVFEVLNIPDPPVASLVGNPRSGVAPLTVFFTDVSSGYRNTWSWDFGDGSTASQPIMSHEYTTPGTYTVSLTVSNAGGSSTDTQVGYVTVLADTIVVSVDPPVTGFVGTPVTLSASATGGAGVLTYSWDFGDGSAPTAPSAADSTIQHTYSSAGSYPVTVTVADESSQSVVETVTQTVHHPMTSTAPTSSTPMSRIGNVLWNVNQDNHTVTAIAISGFTKLFEVPVGQRPRTLAGAADGSVWVVNQESASISVLNSTNGSLLETIQLPRASLPYGIAFSPDGAFVYVALEATGQLVKLNATTRAIIATIEVGPTPRGIAINASSQRIFVTRFISPDAAGEVVEVSANPFEVVRTIALAKSPGPDTEFDGRGLPNYLSSAEISPDGRRLWVPSKKDNIDRGTYRDGLPLTFEHTVRSIVSQVDLLGNTEVLGDRRDVDNRALPVDVAFSPFGDFAYVAHLGSNTIDVIDVYSLTIQASIPDVGLAPDAIVVSNDGNTLWVHSFMSRSVTALDVTNVPTTGGSSVVGTVNTVTTEALSPEVLLGKQIFYNADDPRMSEDSYISCASCHVDGGQDGRIWDFTNRGEGLRNTISLNGRSGTGHGNLHWTANFDEIQDFEQDIRNAFGGEGFLTSSQWASHGAPLGSPKAGLSSDLDALAAYVSSLQDVPASPHRTASGTLTADGIAGKSLFESLQCVSCHSGPDFRDGLSHDVGTIGAGSGQASGAPLVGLDTPTLRGVWRTAPYLHDGSAPTLLDVLTTANPSGAHGDVSGLSAAELAQLVSYLNQIDGPAGELLVPTVASFQPTSGGPGATFTVTGDHFFDVTEVAVGATLAAFTVLNSTTLEVIVPRDAESGPVSVTNVDGTGTSASDFTVVTGPLVATLTDDASVKFLTPDSNYGNDAVLRVRAAGASNRTHHAYFRFDVGGVPSTVTSATLRVYATGGNGDMTYAYASPSNWDEDTITWNSAPAAIGAPVAALPEVLADTWVEFDVTSAVVGNGPVSFVIKRDSPYSVFFSSKEGGFPAELLVEFEDAGPTDVGDLLLPQQFGLYRSFPNPTPNAATIRFDLPRAESVRLTIFDVQGRRVRTLVDAPQAAGRHSIRWDARDQSGRRVSAGVYFYRLEAGKFRDTRKMTVLR